MSNLKIGIVLLAAGASTRMGESGPKQLLEYHGKTLLKHAGEIAAASVCRPLIAVTGFESDRTAVELADLPFQTIYNPDWPDGMGTSIREGLAAMLRHDEQIDGAIIMLCDQPLLTTEILNDLVQTAADKKSEVVASTYGGAAGVPALFARSLFDELLKLPPDHGARTLIKSHQDSASFIPFPGGETDIDTLQSYINLQK
jgi:molybdenum cofactor cytidylyltransferase